MPLDNTNRQFGESTAERTDFWRAAKPIIGDLDKNRKRVKKMMAKRADIKKRIEVTRAGSISKIGRGYNVMNEFWMEHVDSYAVRELGAGRPWMFAMHTAELGRWLDEERLRGHAVDKKRFAA